MKVVSFIFGACLLFAASFISVSENVQVYFVGGIIFWHCLLACVSKSEKYLNWAQRANNANYEIHSMEIHRAYHISAGCARNAQIYVKYGEIVTMKLVRMEMGNVFMFSHN